MKLLKIEDCKVGMIVKLTNPNPNYKASEYNPIVGSDWECEGVIHSVSGGVIHVKWKNGENLYKDNELSLVGGIIQKDTQKEIVIESDFIWI